MVLLDDIAVLHVVQLTLHVFDVLIDLLHTPAVPHDLVLVDLGGDTKAQHSHIRQSVSILP